MVNETIKNICIVLQHHICSTPSWPSFHAGHVDAVSGWVRCNGADHQTETWYSLQVCATKKLLKVYHELTTVISFNWMLYFPQPPLTSHCQKDCCTWNRHSLVELFGHISRNPARSASLSSVMNVRGYPCLSKLNGSTTVWNNLKANL